MSEIKTYTLLGLQTNDYDDCKAMQPSTGFVTLADHEAAMADEREKTKIATDMIAELKAENQRLKEWENEADHLRAALELSQQENRRLREAAGKYMKIMVDITLNEDDEKIESELWGLLNGDNNE